MGRERVDEGVEEHLINVRLLIWQRSLLRQKTQVQIDRREPSFTGVEQGGDVRFLQGNSTAVCISGQFPMVQTQVLCGDLMELPTQTHHLAAGEEPVSAGHDDMDVFRQAVGQDTEEVHDAPIGHQVEVVDKEVVCDGTGQGETEVVHQQAGAGGVVGTRVLFQKG